MLPSRYWRVTPTITFIEKPWQAGFGPFGTVALGMVSRIIALKSHKTMVFAVAKTKNAVDKIIYATAKTIYAIAKIIYAIDKIIFAIA